MELPKFANFSHSTVPNGYVTGIMVADVEAEMLKNWAAKERIWVILFPVIRFVAVENCPGKQ